MTTEQNRTIVLFIAALALYMGGAARAATWTKVAQVAPGDAGTMLLLTDGTIMVQNGGSAQWMRLTPDAKGSYINGNWTSNPINPMSTGRLYYASQVLPNGKVWVLGGEYYGPYLNSVWTSTGEVWDPIANSWSPTGAYPPQSCFGVTYNATGNITSGSTVITNLPVVETPTFLPGWTVAGTGIPSGTTVISVDSPSQVHISSPASITQSSAQLLFSGTPTSCFGDVPSILMPQGKVLTGSLVNNSTYVYDIASNTFAFAANKVYNDSSDEEGWTRLSNGKILTYDIFQSVNTGSGYAEAFDPQTIQWSSISPVDGSANGTLPILSSSALGYELGPSLRLENENAFVIGANGLTALYTPKTNTWAAGPNIMGTLNGISAFFGADDASAAEMPSGHVLLAADAGPSPIISTGNVTNGSNIITGINSTATMQIGWPVTQTTRPTYIPSGATVTSVDSPSQVHISKSATGTANGIGLQFGGVFSFPTQLFDYDPRAGTISPVSPAIPDTRLNTDPAYVTRMLVLPNGQILLSDSSSQLWIYTPDGNANAAYLPVVTNVSYTGNGVYLLTGEKLDGQSAGAAYGDDAQMDENYPIVRLQNSSGNVYYCRTTNWSTVRVGNNSTPETVNFTLNPAVTPGRYSLIVSGAGISSMPVPITIMQGEIGGQ